MKTFKIPLNDPGAPRAARNDHRVFVEVDTIPVSGVGDRYHLPHGKSRAEIYLSELDVWRTKVRTPKHEEVYEQARRMCRINQEAWLRERGVANAPDDVKAELLATKCQESPERHLDYAAKIAGLPPGMPPFASLRVCTPDLSASIPLDEWDNLSEDERRPFLIDPPDMPENAHKARAASFDELVRAMQTMFQNQKPARGRG